MSRSFNRLLIAALTLAVSAMVSNRASAQTKPSSLVEVIGVYEGDVERDADGRKPKHAEGVVTVNVTGDRPVILVLTAYESVRWKVVDPKGLAMRVISSGYYKQSVEGIAPTTELSSSSYTGGDPDYFYARRRDAGTEEPPSERKEIEETWARLVARVRDLTGREIDHFQGAYTGREFDVPQRAGPPRQPRPAITVGTDTIKIHGVQITTPGDGWVMKFDGPVTRLVRKTEAARIEIFTVSKMPAAQTKAFATWLHDLKATHPAEMQISNAEAHEQHDVTGVMAEGSAKDEDGKALQLRVLVLPVEGKALVVRAMIRDGEAGTFQEEVKDILASIKPQ